MIATLTWARRFAMLAVAFLFIAGPGLAKDHDEGRHEEKGHRHADKHREKEERHADKHGHQDIRPGAYFNERHREAARAYFTQHYGHGGHCPPGLAKKRNGCMPPGQAKKWAVGQPLPRDVVVYSLPQPLVVQLPPIPLGHRYIRVGNDIVMVSIDTSLVVDIIANLLD
jgi:Ni/Co efflux regulator RcnB